MDLRTLFALRFQNRSLPNFDKFDPALGIEGYLAAIRKYLLPHSTPATFSAAAFAFEARTYCKGSIFSRVRRVKPEKLAGFLEGAVDLNDFFPPATEHGSVSAGRFNGKGERKLYLADHPLS